MINDFTLAAYMVECFISYAAFLLFLGWAIYKYHIQKCIPTHVYILVMLLFLAIGYSTTLGAYARGLRGDQQYFDFMDSRLWETRVYPRIIIEGLILWRMTRRLYINFVVKQPKRSSDKDGDDI